MGAHSRQFKKRYHKCGNNGHKPTDPKCPKNKKENKNKEKKKENLRKEVLMEIAITVGTKTT